MKRRPRSVSRKLLPTTVRGRLASLLVLAVVLSSGAGAAVSLAQSGKRIQRAESPLKPLGDVPALKRNAPSREVYDRDKDKDRGARRGSNRNAQEDEALQGWRERMRERDRPMRPRELRINRARSFRGDLRDLPYEKPIQREKPEREAPPSLLDLEPAAGDVDTGGTDNAGPSAGKSAPTADAISALAAAAPATTANFDGLDFNNFGAGRPPDTVGDVGKDYYIQAVNTSLGIYRKSDGVRVAAFTFNTFMSQGHFGNLCDNSNFGDPVILYDTFEDRWVISDFAFQLDASNNVVNPPGSFQCFAVSQSGDPLAGGWNYYSINTAGGLGDYPKLGIWPDGIYMSVNMFGYAASAAFQNARVYALNKAQMYAGAPSVQVVSFDAPSSEFTLLPSNARLQMGTPPPGAPNYFSTVWNFANVISVWKFHVDWNSISLSTFTGPFDTLAPASFAVPPSTVPASGSTTGLDTLGHRLMMQNQYTNFGGTESLWNSHTVRGSTTTQSALRYYQVNVNGGTVAANTTQAFTYNPDTTNRLIPSLAIDRAGNMAMGYSATTSATFPSIRYAGRLAGDAANSITQTESVLMAGTGSQTGTTATGGQRWGDYAAMSVDPNGCTYWFTSEYFAVTGRNWLTRVGAFTYPQCTPVGAGGTVQGTVTVSAGGAPLAGATVALGSRTTTTNASGVYSFTNIPAGTYPSITASFPGYAPKTTTSVLVADNATSTVNFALDGAQQAGACFTDTTQADFQTGVPTGVEMLTSPGDVKLSNSSSQVADQVYNPTSLFSAGNLTGTAWVGQTFRAGVTGNLTRLDTLLGLASGTSGTITVEIRNLNGTAPGNTVLATSTFGPVTNVGTAGAYTATFATPAAVVAGTSYAVVLRTSVGNTVFAIRGSGNGYANGALFTTANSGGAWTATTNDLYFTTYVRTPSAFFLNGNLVSGTKDANPAVGSIPNWGALSWTADTPANTAVTFQVAASNNVNGPFNFVGPNGTAATFFTNGGSLSQFNGLRYLRYKASLSTTNNQVTPVLHDVTACVDDLATTALAVAPATGSYGGTATLSATLTSAAGPVNGKSIAFTLNGSPAGTATTDASGVATLPNVSLAGINAGSYPAGVGASFAQGGGYLASSGSNSLTVNRASQTITFAALGDKTYGDAPFDVSATGGASGNPVTFAAVGNCTSGGTNGATITITGAGACTVTASQAGNSNYDAAPDVPQSFNINKASQAITFGALADKTYGDAPFNVSATGGASGNPVTFAATGNCTSGGANGATITITGAGACTVTASQAGNSNYDAAADVPQSFNINKANAVVVVDGYNGTYDGNPHPATGFAYGVGGASDVLAPAVTFTYNGNAAQPVSAAVYNVVASFAGNANYNPASNTTTVTINKATPTISWNNPADIVYGTALSGTQLNATASVPGSFTYTPAAGAVLNAGDGQTLHVDFTPTDTTNYTGASKDVVINVTKAGQTITFGALANKTYGDAPFNVSATGGDSGNPVTFAAVGNCTSGGTNGATITVTGAGACTVTASQAGNSNYDAAADVPQSFNIGKASQTITFAALGDKTYGDAPFTVSATGGNSGNPVTFAAAGNCTSGGTNGATITITGAGTCTVTASQAGNANYEAAADVPQPFSINKANAVVVVNGYNGTYDGNPHGATGTATGAKGEDLTSLLNLGASYTNVPGGTANWAFAGDANHNPSNGSVQIVITQAGVTITWANPADIVYGAALGAAQLNATANVPGSFVYTPAAGTVFGAGGHNLHVAFTPADTVNYTNASKDVSINVQKAVLTITADNKAKTYGDPNPALTYTPSGFVNGDTPATAYAGAPALSTAPANSGAGTYPINAAAGTLASANYSFNFVVGTLNVGKASLTVKADDKSRLVGAANPVFTASYSGFVFGEGPGVLGGTLTFTTPATLASPAGTYPIIPSGLTSPNYNITFVNGTLYVGFNVCVDYDQTQAKKSGSTVPVKFRLCDASGANLSSASIAVRAVSVVNAATNAAQPVQDAGNANPGNYFRFDSGGYIFNLKTTGYPAGTYNLGFTVGGDPTPHAVQFVVRN
ncbi:MAG: carboxypeptidase regulatory-like domain-containing protein [Acidobacteria bacterium]|nr:carboxypeptidase regulatory-like domain-containing protein [Acidobacteriota bacterium]